MKKTRKLKKYLPILLQSIFSYDIILSFVILIKEYLYIFWRCISWQNAVSAVRALHSVTTYLTLNVRHPELGSPTSERFALTITEHTKLLAYALVAFVPARLTALFNFLKANTGGLFVRLFLFFGKF